MYVVLFFPPLLEDVLKKSPDNLEPRHIGMLLSLLQSSPHASERSQVLITLGNSAAFTVNQVGTLTFYILVEKLKAVYLIVM